MGPRTVQLGPNAEPERRRLAYGLIPLLTALNEAGGDSLPVLRAAGIDRFGLTNPAYTIDIEQEVAAVREALKTLYWRHASIEVARRFDLRSLSVLGLAMQSCSTLGEMIALGARYPRLMWGVHTVSALQRGRTLIVRLLPMPSLGDCEDYFQESALAAFLNICREVVDEPIRPVEVRFSGSKPSDISLYQLFFDCPVHFDANHTDLILDEKVWAIPLRAANSLACEFYEMQCEVMSRALDRPFLLAETIRERLLRSDVMPSLKQVSAHIFMTERTLQRRLAAEGYRFADLVRNVRQQRSCELLAHHKLRISEVASILGFRDSVAFSHAFKSWFGRSPSDWRKAQKYAEERRTD